MLFLLSSEIILFFLEITKMAFDVAFTDSNILLNGKVFYHIYFLKVSFIFSSFSIRIGQKCVLKKIYFLYKY